MSAPSPHSLATRWNADSYSSSLMDPGAATVSTRIDGLPISAANSRLRLNRSDIRFRSGDHRIDPREIGGEAGHAQLLILEKTDQFAPGLLCRITFQRHVRRKARDLDAVVTRLGELPDRLVERKSVLPPTARSKNSSFPSKASFGFTLPHIRGSGGRPVFAIRLKPRVQSAIRRSAFSAN